MSDAANPGSVQSVDRALTILGLLASATEVGVTEIASHLGVHKSTAFRLLTTLEQHDLVEQATERGKYRLGVGLLRLAGTTAARLDVVQEARLTARELATRTGETVNVAVLSGQSALYIEQAVGGSTLQPHQWVGQHVPLHATSNGKVLLSELESDALADLLTDLPRFTDRTVTDPTRLRTELSEVARRGYAIAVDELEDGLSAVAVPLRNAKGELIASFSVSGPSMRFRPRMAELIDLVTAGGRTVSRRMGWVEPSASAASTSAAVADHS